MALCIAIYWQSVQPGIITRQGFSHGDKVMHFSVYLRLALLTARLLADETKGVPLSMIRLRAIIFSSLYALSDEIHQAFFPERDASVADLAADMAGCIAGAVI